MNVQIVFKYCTCLLLSVGINCSWGGLPEGRNCSCAWPFWCSELCRADQTTTVQRGRGLCVRGPGWFCLLFTHSGWGQFLESGERCTSDSLSRLSAVVFWDLIAELNQTVLEVQRIQWLESILVSAAPVTGWTSSAGEGSTLLFDTGLYVIVPRQVLRDDSAQNTAVMPSNLWIWPFQCWLHCL